MKILEGLILLAALIIVTLFLAMILNSPASAQELQLRCYPFDDVIMKKEAERGRLPFASGQAPGGTLVIFVNPRSREYAMFHRPTEKFNLGCLMGSGKDFSAFKKGEPT